MNYAPIARILLRYAIGGLLGTESGEILAGDPDIVVFVALGVGVFVELVYTWAKKKGWAT
jgi:hypothetical protein